MSWHRILELGAQLPVYKPVAAIALVAGVGAVIGPFTRAAR